MANITTTPNAQYLAATPYVKKIRDCVIGAQAINVTPKTTVLPSYTQVFLPLLEAKLCLVFRMFFAGNSLLLF